MVPNMAVGLSSLDKPDRRRIYASRPLVSTLLSILSRSIGRVWPSSPRAARKAREDGVREDRPRVRLHAARLHRGRAALVEVLGVVVTELEQAALAAEGVLGLLMR